LGLAGIIVEEEALVAGEQVVAEVEQAVVAAGVVVDSNLLEAHPETKVGVSPC
jgi:hypothetical protein